MRVTRPANSCVARLRHGELKRIPTLRYRPLVGYYIGCPACGRPNPILGSEQTFEEGETLTMMPGHECQHCGKTFRIVADEAEIRV